MFLPCLSLGYSLDGSAVIVHAFHLPGAQSCYPGVLGNGITAELGFKLRVDSVGSLFLLYVM